MITTPLDRLAEMGDWDDLGDKFGSYYGTVRDLLLDLLNPPEDQLERRAIEALHPGGLIRGMMQYSQENPEVSSAKLIQAGVKLGNALYQNSENVPIHIQEFMYVIQEQWEAGKILALNADYSYDFWNWWGVDPSYSNETVLDLDSRINGESVLFLPIARGAIDCTLDIALKYAHLADNFNCGFHPIRFSRYGQGDLDPVVSNAEFASLKKAASRYQNTVVIDENSITGQSIEDLMWFLREEVYENRRPNIIGRKNLQRETLAI